MKGHISVRKTVGGVSRLALAVCLVVLVIVFVTAYGVGTSTANPRKARLMSTNIRVLNQNKVELEKCDQMRKTYLNGDKLTNAQLIASLQEREVAAKEALKMEKEREASIRSVVQRCTDDVDTLRKKAFGATAKNITAYLAELETRRVGLLDQLESLTNLKEMHRRSDLITLEKALVQQLTEVNRQQLVTDRVSACAKSPVKFSVVFDIGSSGNRVHVYKYSVNAATQDATTATPSVNALATLPTTTRPRDILNEIKLDEELFRYNYDALTKLPNPVADAPRALRKLFDAAKAFVPQEQHVCTPVEFKATAGLRSVGADTATATLSAIRQAFLNESFWLRGSAPVRMLDGKEEGPMAWLTVNFLLGSFDGHRSGGSRSNSTVAVIDLGGGSTQVVFEPHEAAFNTVPSHQQFTAQFGSRPVRAYQHCYEGFGLHAATRALLYSIQGKLPAKPSTTTTTAAPTEQQQQHGDMFNALFGGGGGAGERNDGNGKRTERDGDDGAIEEAKTGPSPDPIAVVAFPCFAAGYTDPLGVSNTKPSTTVEGTPVSGPNFTACANLFRDRLLRPVGESCPTAHCGIGRTHQPPLEQFAGDIYVISFVFDLLEAANATSLAVSPDEFAVRLADVEQIGVRRCAALTLDSIKTATVRSSLQPVYDCMYYAYSYALLKYGYGIPQDRSLHVVKRIQGYEMAWTLGASLISIA
ncbi:putative nucleoside phosphatase putativeguanosine diphosphatase [Leptomonas pyrrhocoris]|uniref:Putative nucleoside phosphatase putativeguanosine diphosphatase n=1 Tax=Leptomonas pyrrhocoris TaxID=157538 RepID=A0A0M9FTZ0_LEPPY|nr:putative nucleoside phosphatase putativeguanosine diphosphatase [Leptomonas pyrrhocoris]KPA75889.1 putative nucleoside phosphatase putativeguanosine diphosphatase [Leptomonas pyrrhocoris]|eukprot:XP_015654328.1 putative nucleoside phosphatase putativeguanosine diphosphatase [Leptomonas pyrrhocoris]